METKIKSEYLGRKVQNPMTGRVIECDTAISAEYYISNGLAAILHVDNSKKSDNPSKANTKGKE